MLLKVENINKSYKGVGSEDFNIFKNLDFALEQENIVTIPVFISLYLLINKLYVDRYNKKYCGCN